MNEVEDKMTEQGQLAIKTELIKNNLDELLFRFDLYISSELKNNFGPSVIDQLKERVSEIKNWFAETEFEKNSN
jgi:hypothetical protein